MATKNNPIVWIGIREAEIEDCDFFSDYVCLFGEKNSLEKELGYKINHDDPKNFQLIDTFYDQKISKILQKNKNTNFMYYSQIYSYKEIKESGLLPQVLCLNNQELVETLNDKFKTRDIFSALVPVLSYKYLEDPDLAVGQKLVFQSRNSSGGSGTFISPRSLKLKGLYAATEYLEPNIPINIHVLISKEKVQLFPASVQKIKIKDSRLTYAGYDFEAFNQVDHDVQTKVREYALKIGSYLKKERYLGIFGIDSIIYQNEVYFIEINPRFQNSSIGLNKILKEFGGLSLQEQVYNCFYSL